MHTHKILNIPAPNIDLARDLSSDLGISSVVAQVLINRGIKNSKEAEKFLNPKLEYLLDPYDFREMPKAVSIIKKAADNKDKVLIFSDYDVDGLTSLALLENTFSKLGADTLHYIPNRMKEGYGLNDNIIELCRKENVKVLVTADCGTNSDEEIKELRKLGMEVIVTDHHEPLHHSDGSCASATLNAKLKDSGYGFRNLAGVGVAYKFCQAVMGGFLAEELDLVALGTIADAVPLTGENRVIAKEGLSCLSQTKRVGLRTLMDASGIRNKKITPSFVSFILGPRINASGRIDTAETALSLLVSREKEEAESLAKTVEMQNRQRQKIENTILTEAQDLIDKEVNFKEHKIMVVAKEGWHTGVLGIVAAKLTERFCRPTILISLTEDLCKGSGRSIKNFHLFEAILECRDLLESFGGHQHATGLAISKDNITDFKHKINRLAREKLSFEDLLPSLDIDMELSLQDLNDGLIKELEKLEPFGMANSQPLFYTRSLRLKGAPRLLARDTLKFWVTDGQCTYQAIGFGIGGFKESLENADYFDLVYSAQVDSWEGIESPILEVKEIFFK